MCGRLNEATPGPGLPARGAMLLVRAYQLLVSPWLGPHCRYQPTCSSYALEAIGRFGALRGSWLALRRIGRCHPWAAGGLDPVPRRYCWWGRSAAGPAD